jgi:hypothetical protein
MTQTRTLDDVMALRRRIQQRARYGRAVASVTAGFQTLARSCETANDAMTRFATTLERLRTKTSCPPAP